MENVRARKGTATRLAIATTVVITSLVAASCGGETYDDVLRGLQKAALSGKTYNALSHTDDLKANEKAVINAFCSVATQLADNGETITEEQYFERIRSQTESDLGVVASLPVNAAVGKLRAIYDLASINGGTANLYVRACFP